MKNKQNRGFTLLELMIVVVLISILAAVTVPKLMQVSNRNKLGEVTNLFQQTVAEARGLAMKTRQAVVVEVRDDQLWVNLLDGESCDSLIGKRCFHNFGSTRDAANTNIVNLNTTEFNNAGVDMCNLRVAVLSATETCVPSGDLQASGVGLCYNGSGQLWIRTAEDDEVACTKTGDPTSDEDDWLKACVPWAIEGAGKIKDANKNTYFSGADVRFNRFPDADGDCPVGGITPSGAEDITRRVIVPAGGHPFVKTAEEDK